MDATRIPVIAAVGQSVEREEIIDAVGMAARAAGAALDAAPGLRDRIERVSLISVVFSPSGPKAATELAERLGLKRAAVEVSSAGGNMPQWMVTRAAKEIAEGRLDATLIAGGEATRSFRAANPGADFMGQGMASRDATERDPEVGPSLAGTMHPAEIAIRLIRPTEVYPLFENARAHREGRSFEQQRERVLGPLMASFSEVASQHPYAWFREALSADEIATPTDRNRLISEPYTKQMNAFPNVDQGAAVVVTSLATARALGLADRCLFVWSGANNAEPPAVARPDLGDAPAMRTASAAALEAAGIGADELALIDLYSCFPIAVEIAAAGLGVALDDPRRLTVTGGLPFFGGPGNDYSMHAIATVAERLPETGGLAYVGANGGVLSKHSIGVYGTTPPPRGFVAADTSARQAELDATALPVAAPGEAAEGTGEVVASTVTYERDGSVADAPVIVTLDDGRRVAARADASLRGALAGRSLIGERVVISGDPATSPTSLTWQLA